VAELITWSGIALHGGALPGYPASHGWQRLYGKGRRRALSSCQGRFFRRP